MTRRVRSLRDGGGVLVLTLVLTVILASVVIALASYVTVGLRTADTATDRVDTNFDAANVMNWAIEEFSKKQLRPQDCGEAPSNYVDITTVPSALYSNGSTTTLKCAKTLPAAEPVVHLIATSVGEQTRVVEATLTVPRYVHGVQVSDWRVDIPIDVLPFGSTTTTISTTTSTTIANAAPIASATSLTINPGGPFTQSVLASDPDGTVTALEFLAPLPANLTALTPISGPTFEVTNDGSIGTSTVQFRVQDDAGAWSNVETLTIIVDTVATTTTAAPSTTTTLAPNPSCTFRVTSAAGDNKSGIANLAISNTGGAFSGWQVVIGWPGSWAASWESSVVASLPSPNVTVSGAQTVGESTTLNFTATLAWTGGNPKIFVNDTRSCTVVSP